MRACVCVSIYIYIYSLLNHGKFIGDAKKQRSLFQILWGQLPSVLS